MMRKKAAKVLGAVSMYLILAICVGLTASPLLKYFILKAEGSRYQFRSFPAEELERNADAADNAAMEQDITVPDIIGIMKHIKKAKRSNVIGWITIEKVGVSLPVFNGTTKENLMVGAGTMQSGRQMGKGNYCLAGHHMKDKSLLFGPLEEVKKGDWIQLTDKKEVYTYSITESRVIHQSSIEVMEESNCAIVTLITCDKTGVNTDYRLMVKGELVDRSEVKEGEDNNSYLKAYNRLEGRKEEHEEYLLWIWLLGVLLTAGLLYFAGNRLLRV